MATGPVEIGDVKLLFLDYKGAADLDSISFLIEHIVPFL
jgi:hypothetical protein